MLIPIFKGAQFISKYLGGGKLLPAQSLVLLGREREDISCVLDLILFRGKERGGGDWGKLPLLGYSLNPLFLRKRKDD